ncbi:MAG: arginase family protein [Candidatus Acidiferrales bacterium]
MAVKVTRQPDKIALLGAPTSAAGLWPGNERAPAALRAAGLSEQLRAAGFEVIDHGDDPVQLSQPDEESPRARNLPRVVKSLEALRPRVEIAVKSGALPIILTGDCTIALATVAGVRRYFHNVSMIYMDRDADLNVPATTPSGCVDGMVVAHLTGRGAAELVRFWGEPPLIRDPDIALFGVDRLDPPEEEFLRRAPIRVFSAADIRRQGAAAAARTALDRVHANRNEFILHFDVDVIENFQGTNYPGSGGLTLDDVRAALEVFIVEPRLVAITVAAYNPEKDPDSSGAKQIIELLASVLALRRQALAKPASEPVAAAAAVGAASPREHEAEQEPTAPAPEVRGVAASFAPGEAWTSDPLESETETPEAQTAEQAHEAESNDENEALEDVAPSEGASNGTEESHS